MRIRGRFSVGIAALSVTAVTAVAAGCSGPSVPPGAGKVIQAYVSAWGKGDARGMARLTDDPGGATRTISQAFADLRPTATSVETHGAPSCPQQVSCTQGMRVTMTLAGLGRWTYDVSTTLRADHDTWRVHWAPTVFHPQLTAKKRFRVVRDVPNRASIQDRDGKPLTKDRPVVRLSVDPAKVTAATYQALTTHLGVDATRLRKDVAKANQDSGSGTAAGSGSTTTTTPDGQVTVPAITIREPVWENVAGHFKGLPGLVVATGSLSLAESSTFARAILGVVGTGDADATKHAGTGFLPTDDVGESGLQYAYQAQLAGRPGGHVELYEPSTGDVTNRLVSLASKPGQPLRTTLSSQMQRAAENAVAGQSKPTAVVAVQASTGQVLAAANGPGLTSYDRALVGKYPPGSTFKVVTSAVLLQRGLKITDKTSCPKTAVVGGRAFKNVKDMTLPDGPFTTMFAHSCNTAFVPHAKELGDEDIAAMAKKFGVGASWDVGLPAYSGSVPTASDQVDKAAEMIGQGRVLTSPLGMAMVAAAADSGQPRTPSLLPSKPSRAVGGALPDAIHKDLRTLMRAVVTEGSAKPTLGSLPGDVIYAKTGTAEYATGGGLGTHAWIVGFRGDVAFAVVIEGGGAGGKDAGPVARAFLQGAPELAAH